MNSTATLTAALAALITYCGPLSATPMAAQDAPQPPPAGASNGTVNRAQAALTAPAAAPQSPVTTRFGGDPCQVSPELGLELVELGAFHEWQGARTTPEGDAEALRFGALAEQAAAAAADDTAEQVAAELTGSAHAPGPDMHERRRMFLLGLAILLNLNTKP